MTSDVFNILNKIVLMYGFKYHDISKVYIDNLNELTSQF